MRPKQDFFVNAVYMAGKPPNSRWDIACQNGIIHSISECPGSRSSSTRRFLSPSLCHPHIHLDKCFLLSHPKYEDLEIQDGDFKEALELTSQAKARFEHDDLIERGQALVEESIDFGVTHMRAFVEVDLDVRMKCLDAGLELKEQFRNRCYIQICVFAQNPIVSYEDEGKEMMELLEEAVKRDGVEVLGSTPYVEEGGDPDLQFQNMKFTIRTAMKYGLHLDFHIDYNLDDGNAIMVTKVLDILYAANWPSNSTKSEFRTIVFGHCTRLTLFNHYEWRDLKARIGDLPISFVGLPTSDLFMMGRPDSDVHPDSGGGVRVRGTLQIPQMIKEYGLNGAIGINNVGNAFTPQGSCDPLGLASLGVAVYQAGTKEDADILLQCVSTRAKNAIGVGFPHPNQSKRDEGSNYSPSNDTALAVGDPADFVIFGESTSSSGSFRARTSTQSIVNDAGQDRTTVYQGHITSHEPDLYI